VPSLDRNELGITYRQLDHWVTRGYLRPENKPGSGYGREFSESEIEIAKLMAKLVHAGFRAEKAAKTARYVLAEGLTRLRLADDIILVLSEPRPESIRFIPNGEEGDGNSGVLSVG
jgi:hypothetical protein